MTLRGEKSFLEEVNLTHADLSGATLTFYKGYRFIHLGRARMSKAVLIGCLRNVLVGNTDLSGADLTKAWGVHHALSGCDLTNANLSGAKFCAMNFDNSILINVNFRDANLTKSTFTGSNLSKADLTGANLYGAEFVNANLKGTTVIRCRFVGEKNEYGLPYFAKFENCHYDRDTDFTDTFDEDERSRGSGQDGPHGLKARERQLLVRNMRRFQWEKWYRQHPALQWPVRMVKWCFPITLLCIWMGLLWLLWVIYSLMHVHML